jgi:hypothetical protein
MHRTFTLLSALVVSATIYISVADAHSWYPRECCSDHDCTPADSLHKDRHGDTIVIVGANRIWVPRGFVAQPSHDDQIHICFRENEFDFKAICLFLPAQS